MKEDIDEVNEESRVEMATVSDKLKIKQQKYPPSFFTDEVGNLKFVNLVVRHPCKIFFVILFLNIILTFLLFATVFRGGNPFSDPGSQYDPNDVRSIAYDSLKLAGEEIEETKAAPSDGTSDSDSPLIRVQEQQLDITYWVYEAESEDGVFGTRESIEGMKESLALFQNDPMYESYCWKQYETVVEDDDTTTTTSKCRPALSSLSMYYASSWDADVAESIIQQLQEPGNIDRYNDVALCVEFNLLCEFLALTNYTDSDLEWARSLNADITSMTSSWDGKGELAEDLQQVTRFALYMMELNTKRGFVDFGFDKNFNLTNPVSMFSRAVLLWGGPLEESLQVVSETEESEEEEGDNDKDQAGLREYFLANFLERMNEISSVEHDPNVNSFYFMVRGDGRFLVLKTHTCSFTEGNPNFGGIARYCHGGCNASACKLRLRLSLPSHYGWFLVLGHCRYG